MATTYDTEIKQGATFKLLMTILDPSDVPINLTGYTFRGQVRDLYSSDRIQATFSFELQPQTGGTLGQVMCILTATETAGIEVPATNQLGHRRTTKMLYDIESDNGGGEVVRWLEGVATISPEVTR